MQHPCSDIIISKEWFDFVCCSSIRSLLLYLMVGSSGVNYIIYHIILYIDNIIVTTIIYNSRSSSSYDMSWISVFLLVGLFLPSNSVLLNKTFEFISEGTLASFSHAHSWCKKQGSTLAEIKSEYIWNRTLQFVDASGLTRNNLILNANGKELLEWQWITGETFRDVDSYKLQIDHEMYGFVSKIKNREFSITKSLPNCGDGCNNGYVCEHPGDGSCNTQSSNNSILLDGNCYVFHHDNRVNWFEAYYECYKYNGRLATFKNIKTEEASIAQKLVPRKKYWIGLYRYEMEMGRFKWTARFFELGNV